MQPLTATRVPLVWAAILVAVVLVIMATDLRGFHIQRGLLIAFCIGLTVLIGIVLWRYERRQARITMALRESEERTRATFNAISDAVFLHPLVEEGFAPFVDVNDTACERYGYTRQEFLALTAPDITKKVDALAHSTRDHRRKLRDTKRLIFEVTHLSKYGEEIPVEINSAIIELDGRPMILTVARDLAERKRAEVERERLMSAIEQAAETVMITDVEGTIQYANPAFEEITGYSREEAIGQNPRFLKSDEHDSAFYEGMWETLQRGETWAGRIVNRRKDRTLFTEEATISPVRDAAGETVSYVAVKRDVTHEDALAAQLRQAQKMEAVGQLAGGVAHDFNNLLQAIYGHAEMALEELSAGHPAHSSIEEVVKAGERGAALTRQLLAFSRQQLLEMKDIDLNEVIADLMKMTRRVLGAHITLDVVAGQELGTVRADPGQIEQILMNLCVNARDAMPDGGRIIIETENVRLDEAYCQTHTWAKPGRFVLLTVTDTGCGIDEETLTQIFDPFFTTKDVGEGTGLGLSTVYGLVKQHGGMVHVYSEVGIGTTFKVYLPQTDRLAVSVGNKIAGPMRGGTETILLAEDDATVLALTKEILERAGYKVLAAIDGEEALRVFNENAHAIDLAQLDVVMPKLGGRGVYERIREARPETRFLFASGYSTSAVHTNFVLDDGLQLIQKPHQSEVLLRKVREVLDA